MCMIPNASPACLRPTATCRTEEQYLNHDIDLIVMNTCAVRENAAERMYGTIGLWAELKRERPNLQIAVGGLHGAARP